MNKQGFDVVLVQPNITWVYDPFEHLGLGYLAASLRKAGFRVKIIDAVLLKLSMAELYRRLDLYDISVLGVTLVSHGYLSTVKFLEYYRKRHTETKIIGGGHFATFATRKILDDTNVFDGIVLGEGDFTFIDYCKSVIRGEDILLRDIMMPQRETLLSGNRILNMDVLPFPARDNLSLAMSQGATPSVTSSRGCYARCAFCTVHRFYTASNGLTWAARSIENVIEELRMLHARFGISHFMFVDDNFIGPGPRGQQRAKEFAEAYGNSNLPMTFHIDCRAVDVRENVFEALRAVGLTSVFVGIESVSQSDLNTYRKGLKSESNLEAVRIMKKLNLNYTLSMIMFNPVTNEKSILDNVNFLKEAKYFPRNPLSILNLYEGTDLNMTFKDYMYGPFWDYRFRFAHESTRIIYEESMKFCKDTLPFERELSKRPGGCPEGRQALNRLRLLFLEDITKTLGKESIMNVHTRWRKMFEVLRHELSATSASSASQSKFGEERLYMTGSPMDSASLIRG